MLLSGKFPISLCGHDIDAKQAVYGRSIQIVDTYFEIPGTKMTLVLDWHLAGSGLPFM